MHLQADESAARECILQISGRDAVEPGLDRIAARLDPDMVPPVLPERRTGRLVVLQIIILIKGPSLAAVNAIESDPEQPAISSRASNVLKILSVLENRMVDHTSLEKAKDKLFRLSDNQTKLIASLSDQVVKERNPISGDVAFLLMTALIILL